MSSPGQNQPDSASTLLRHFPAEVVAAYQRFSVTRDVDAADQVVIAALRDHMPKNAPAPVVMENHHTLTGDLGLDSVDIAEFVFFLEDLFQVRITNDEIIRVRTVGDLRSFVREKIATAQPSP